MNEVKTYRNQKFDFENLFNQSEKTNGHVVPFLKTVRENAAKTFMEKGLPGKADENYKYLSLDSLFSQEYSYRFLQEIIHFDINHVFRCDIPDLNTHLVILLNGFYYGGKDRLIELPEGVKYGSMMQAAVEMPDVFQKHYSKIAAINTDGLVDMNTALSRDGFFIYVPKNTVAGKPIQVVNLILSAKDLFLQPRNMVVLEEGADLELVVCDHALSKKRSLSNSVTETIVGENAKLDFTVLQNDHNFASQINYHFIEQEKNSRVDTNTISLHGGLIRNNHFVRLNGTGAQNYLGGLYLTDKDQYLDNYVFVDHAVPQCYSEQFFKGVLDDRAKGVFNGKILVRQDAQKTQAYQKNNSILLTEDAKMHTRPQLEIYTDDVKCSHGATVGQVNEEAMFYLRSRGIPEKEARLMMMYGFTHEVVSKIRINSLRERIEDFVQRRLRGELAKCENCSRLCT